jgi:hypothetical protein
MAEQQFVYIPDKVHVPPATAGETVTTDLRPEWVPEPEPDLDLSAYVASRREQRGKPITVKLAPDFTVHVLPFVSAAPFIDEVVEGLDNVASAVRFLTAVLLPGEFDALREWVRQAQVDLATFDHISQKIVEAITAGPTGVPST